MSVAAWSGGELSSVARALANAIEGEVRFGLHDRLLYATDASIYQVEPLGVVIPASCEDAARAVAFCHAHGLPMLPRGGGTSLAGQAVNRAVVMDLSAGCARVRSVDSERGRAWAEAGVAIADLNAAVQGAGLHFAPDPSTTRQATVGGCIGNNAAGAHSVLYGRTSENVRTIEACLADGRVVRFGPGGDGAGGGGRGGVAAEIARRVCGVVRRHAGLIRERFPKTLRRSAGYQLDEVLRQLDAGVEESAVSLAPLLCGSEGTLAVTLAAEVELRRLPRSKGLAVIAFEELDAAIAAVMPMLGMKPAAVELLDDLIVESARKNAVQRRNLERLPSGPAGARVRAFLYVEFFSEREGDGFEREFGEIRERFGAAWVSASTDAAGMSALWALRIAGEPLLHALDPVRKPLGFIEDNAVPPERLGEFVGELRGILAENGTVGSFYAHASVGVLHVRPLLNPKLAEDLPRMRSIAWRTAELAKRLGGVMSGEHGDGRARGPLVPEYFGEELMGAFREVKAIFDPKGLLNPGNIVSPGGLETISEDLRVAPRVAADKGGEVRAARFAEVETYYTYEAQHGLDGAVEMCNGAGVCRKRSGGTMCPSYMASLDERHSTRGRANELRLAMTGQLDPAGRARGEARAAWGDEHVMETLDLCLSCKACKSECPSNVDVAKLKAEYLAQTYRARRMESGQPWAGASVSSRVFGRIHWLSAMAGWMPGVVNWMNGWGPSRGVIDWALGLDGRRSLPEFAEPLHRQWGRGGWWGRGGRGSDGVGGGETVVLYGDTFTTYNEPGIGLAARELLEGLGYRVRLFRGTDAARALISVGMVEEAIGAIEGELGRLRGVAEDAGVVAVVHCEPSVLSAVLDDWRTLKVRDEHGVRERLAAKSMLVEQFVASRWGEHPGQVRGGGGGRVRFVGGGREVVLHAHCHQKALWGAGSSGRALELALGGVVRVLDSGCCGMAGSFGYTKGRYELSMRVGELSLFPSVREATGWGAGSSGGGSSGGVDGRGAVVCASGTSCRHQIFDGTGVRAQHPVEVLREAMVVE